MKPRFRLRFRLLVITALAALGVFAASALAAAPGLQGTLTAQIKAPPQVAGNWKINLAKSGKVTIKRDGKSVTSGTYSSTGSTVTFTPTRAAPSPARAQASTGGN
jgi:hypothetical protein